MRCRSQISESNGDSSALASTRRGHAASACRYACCFQPSTTTGCSVPSSTSSATRSRCICGGQTEVVAQIPRRRDSERACRDRHELTPRLLRRRYARGPHALRQHALGEIVQALEIPPPRGRHVADPEQPLQDFLALAPAPPAALRFAAVRQLARAERAALANLLQRRGHQLLVRGRVTAQSFPRALAVARTFHAPAKQRIQLDGQERRFVAPVFEQRAAAVVRRALEQLRRIRRRNANRRAGSANAPARSRNRSALRRDGARSCRAPRAPSAQRTRRHEHSAPPGRCGVLPALRPRAIAFDSNVVGPLSVDDSKLSRSRRVLRRIRAIGLTPPL